MSPAETPPPEEPCHTREVRMTRAYAEAIHYLGADTVLYCELQAFRAAHVKRIRKAQKRLAS